MEGCKLCNLDRHFSRHVLTFELHRDGAHPDNPVAVCSDGAVYIDGERGIVRGNKRRPTVTLDRALELVCKDEVYFNGCSCRVINASTRGSIVIAHKQRCRQDCRHCFGQRRDYGQGDIFGCHAGKAVARCKALAFRFPRYPEQGARVRFWFCWHDNVWHCRLFVHVHNPSCRVQRSYHKAVLRAEHNARMIF